MIHTKTTNNMKTQLLRDTNYSFLKTTTNGEGKEFSRKLEKGSTDYSNACMTFHANKTTIEIGNSVNK